jgi:hypothetical protein
LVVDDGELDAALFEEELATARQARAAGYEEKAAELL